MKYFCYQNSRVMGPIWNLFTELGDMQRVANSNVDYAHTVEIVNAALNGSLPTTPDSIETFNLKAYEYKCRENDNNNLLNMANKELHIVTLDTTTDKDAKVGKGDIADIHIPCIDNAFMELDSRRDFDDNLRELLNIRSKYIVTHGVDVISVLRNALEGIPEAVTKFRDLVLSDTKLRDLYQSLCDNGSGYLLDTLEAMA